MDINQQVQSLNQRSSTSSSRQQSQTNASARHSLVDFNDNTIEKQHVFMRNGIAECNPITFAFKWLFEQFRKYGNLFLLIICLLQQIANVPTTAGQFITLVSLVILTVSTIKQIVADIRAGRTESQVQTRVITTQKFDETATCEQVKVDDMVKCTNDEQFPSINLIVSSSSKPNGMVCHMETTNLDGDKANLQTRQGLRSNYEPKLFNKYDPLEHVIRRDLLTKFSEEMYAKRDFRCLERIVGYQFKNRALLIQAFKHGSHDDPYQFPTYERLEFLGDAVIDYLVIQYFYDGKLSPGQLANLKESLINNELFGTLMIKYGLDRFFIQRCPALISKISLFKAYYERFIKPKGSIMIVPNSYMVPDSLDSIDFDNDVEIPKCLGDIFESLIGAIFIDSGKS